MLYFIKAYYSKKANSDYYKYFYYPLNQPFKNGWYIATYKKHANGYDYRNGRIQSSGDWIYL